MGKKDEVAKAIQKNYIDGFLRDPTGYSIEVIAGMTKDTQSGYDLIKAGALFGGNVVKGFIHGQGVTNLLRELEKAREKGKIINYLDDPWGRDTLADLFNALQEKELPPSEKLEVIKALLLASLKTGEEDKKKMMARELIRVAVQLEAMDVQILKFLDSKREDGSKIQGGTVIQQHAWEESLFAAIGREISGLILDSIVKLKELHLVDKPRGDHPPMYTQEQVARYGLSLMGITLIDYVKEFGGSEA